MTSAARARPKPGTPGKRVARDAAVKAALDVVRGREDLIARRANDPVEFVHRHRARADKELVALLAASCAFGNVKAIRKKRSR